MSFTRRVITVLAWALAAASGAAAQSSSLPTSQPNLLRIDREIVKVGHAADHVKTESGWPAAFANAKSPDYYLAMVSLTGAPEVWFVAPYESHAALGEAYRRENDDPVLSTELARLQRADAEHVEEYRAMQLMARKDLSYGQYPDIGKQRFWEVTIFRVRPGQESGFVEAAKAYGAAAGRANQAHGFRVYEVMAGVPGPTYYVFSSVPSFAEFDKMMAEGEATMKAMTPQEREALTKFSREGLVNVETQRFRLDPQMSYVAPETRATDPAFWSPKKPSN